MVKTKRRIQVGGVQHRPRQLAEKIGGLIDRLEGTDYSNTVPAMRLLQISDPLGGIREGFVPADGFEAVVDAKKGLGEAFGVMDDLVAVPPLDTEGSPADRVVSLRRGGQYHAFFHLQEHSTATSAKGTRRLNFHLLLPL